MRDVMQRSFVLRRVQRAPLGAIKHYVQSVTHIKKMRHLKSTLGDLSGEN